MKHSRIASRYARAIFQVTDTNNRAKYLEVLEALAGLFDDAEIAKVLSGPVFPKKLKKDVFAYALGRFDADPTMNSFIAELVDAGRTSSILQVAAEFRKLIDQSMGVVKGEIVIAASMSEADMTSIAEKLSKRFGQKVLLSQRIDPSILGGFVVRVGNSKLDYSLKTKIDKLAHVAMS